MFLKSGFVVALVLLACGGSVTVRKATSESVEGYRYYLPRPFLAVKREFPWTSDDAYVQGTITKVGEQLFLVIDPADIERLKLDPGRIPAGSVLYSPSAIRSNQQRSIQGATETKDDGDKPKDDGEKKDEEKDKEKDKDKGDKKDEKSGEAKAEETPKAPASGLVVINEAPFDVIYLPDFDEQYAIDARSGSTVTELKLHLDNGWMLSDVNQKVDNSAILTAVTTQVDKTLDLLRQIASLKAGLPTGESTDDKAIQAQSGSKITVRVRTITYVTSGLFPLLKKAERAANCHSSTLECWFALHTRTERFFEAVTITAPTLATPKPPGSGSLFDRVAGLKKAKQLLEKDFKVTVKSATAESVVVSWKTPPADRDAEVTKMKKKLESDPTWKSGVAVVVE